MKVLQNNNITDRVVGKQALKLSRWNDIIAVDSDTLVVFNTRTRSAVLISRDEYARIYNTPEKYRQQLYNLGILIDADIDELKEFEADFNRGKHDLSYIDLTILLTHNCQFNCTYCFEGAKQKVNINENTADNIIAYLTTLLPVLKKLRVIWFGGEPLVAYDRLKSLSLKFIDFCKKHDLEYVADITTNGYALDSKRCHELLADLNVKRFIITVDGPAEIHDRRRPLRNGKPTFNTIRRNISLLVKEGARVTLRMTIDKENAPYIHDLLNLISESEQAQKIGLSFCRTIDYNYTPADIKTNLYTEAEFMEIEWDCITYAHSRGLWRYSFPHAAPAGGCLRQGDIVISASGEIYKCLDTIGDIRWKTASVEDLLSNDNSTHPQWYKRWLDWTPVAAIQCRNCVLMPLCSGGCPHNELFNDKMHGSESQCPDWKANYRRQIKEIAKQL